MRYENFLNVFLILLSEIVITTKNMFFKGNEILRYQNFSYKKCKYAFYRRNSNRDKKTFEIGFICSLRFLDSLSRNTHEILD